jgi:hypothetical protein
MLTAASVPAALIRRAKEGDSYCVRATLAQTATFEMRPGLNDKASVLDIASLGPGHQVQRPNLVRRRTSFGAFSRLGSQVEMSQTPEFWTDPILVPMGSSRPEGLPKPNAHQDVAPTTREVVSS